MRRYWIRLRGFEGHEVIAPNAAKAKAYDYRCWREAGYGENRHDPTEKPFKRYLDRIEAVHALGEVGGDPRTPKYGVAA